MDALPIEVLCFVVAIVVGYFAGRLFSILDENKE